MKAGTAALLVTMLVAPATAFADDPPAPDKSGFNLFDPTPQADLRPFDTDRPTKSNVPYTVDAGHFQYETDLAVYSYQASGGVRATDWTIVDPTLKVGLTNTIDAELQITPYESAATKTAGRTTRLSGLGDTYARIKVNVLGDDHGDLAIAILPYVKLPTAQSMLGNGRVEGGLILPISFNAPGGYTILVMPQVDELKDAGDGGYHRAFDFLVNVSHPIGKRWALYAEVFTSQSFQAHDDKPVYTADTALTYMLTPKTQVDIGGNFGLSDQAPRAQIYAGLSQRF